MCCRSATDVVLSVTLSEGTLKPDAAYTWVTVGLAPVTTGLPSPKFQLYVVIVPPVSLEVDPSNAHDKPVQFAVKSGDRIARPEVRRHAVVHHVGRGGVVSDRQRDVVRGRSRVDVGRRRRAGHDRAAVTEVPAVAR